MNQHTTPAALPDVTDYNGNLVEQDGPRHVSEALAAPAELIPNGIHFGLPDTAYHADPALGSTGLKKLLQSAPDFWWQSPFNSAKEPEKETPAKLFGRAVHRCVLEGRAAFEAEYAPTDHNGSTKAGKAEREAIAAVGKRPLARDDYTRILAAAAFIKANPHLARAFEGGMAEVSIFWERDGVRLKARLDYLKLNAITDLKSIRNTKSKAFAKACTDRVAEFDYTLSAEHYAEGRRQMARLIAEGQVFGEHDPVWLRNVAANDAFAFVLVFWQAEGAPVSHGLVLSPGNPLFDYAKQSIAHAIHNYQTFLQQFGTDTAWVLAERLQELDETDLPVWWQQKIMKG